MIESVFKKLLEEYNVSQSLSRDLWNELEEQYTSKNRHYHNLNHLSDLYSELQSAKTEINEWQIILFSMFYHDVIYKSTKKNNEEKSAELAVKRLTQINLPKAQIEKCFNQIIATKSHQKSDDYDTDIFTDADLSILGRDRETYKRYCENIRKEYSIYPDFLYSKGRRKVVNHFLSMNRIFKTDFFFNKYEEKAISNLNNELTIL